MTDPDATNVPVHASGLPVASGGLRVAVHPTIDASGIPAAPGSPRVAGLSANDAAGLPAASGGPRAAVSPCRAAVYFDGFNLFHAIEALGARHLHWISLRMLAEQFVRRQDRLGPIVWCTAVNTRNVGAMLRAREFRNAQLAEGVRCLEGHFVEEPRRCPEGHDYFHPTEKEGDVNLAISLIADAYENRFDVAYLVTADSDQIATLKLFRSRFPAKRIVSVAPPARVHSRATIRHASGTKVITRADLEASLLPGPVLIRDGVLVARRPEAGAPPDAP